MTYAQMIAWGKKRGVSCIDWAKKHDVTTVFIVVFLAYYHIRTTIPDTGDAIAVTLQAFNLFLYGTLAFDHLKGGYITSVYSDGGFMMAPNGHFTNAYPIGIVLLALPLHALFFVYMKIIGKSTDISNIVFWKWRVRWSHMAAMVIAAGAAACMYAASKRVSSQRRALIVTVAFAFCTTQWIISAQTMWQHGGVSFLLALAIYGVVRVLQATTERERGLCLLLLGGVAGFLILMRPTAAVFSAALGLFVLWQFRGRAWPFLLTSAIGPCVLLGYNYWLFEKLSLMGGYASQTSLYAFTGYNFIHAFPGLLFSPSKGLLVYSPFLLFCIPAVISFWKTRQQPISQFMMIMYGAASILFLNYCFFRAWHGDAAYGPRFLTDMLPILCFSLNYVRLGKFWGRDALATLPEGTHKNYSVRGKVLATMLLWAGMVQATCVIAGVRGHDWPNVPNYILGDISFSSRYWDWGDSQIIRSAQSIINQLTTKTAHSCTVDIAGYAFNERDELLSGPIRMESHAMEGKTLYMGITNKGDSLLRGYKSGLYEGRLEIETLLKDAQGNGVHFARGTHYMVSNTAAGKVGRSVLMDIVAIPKGNYTLTLTPKVNGNEYCQDKGVAQSMMLPVIIE